MKLILGIDEAGYGPNLGPLVIACTAWTCNADFAVDDWAEKLKPEFSNTVSKSEEAPIALGDSKILYSTSSKLWVLDRTVGFFLSRLSKDNPLMLNRFDIIDRLDNRFNEQLNDARWLDGHVTPSEHIVAPEQIQNDVREQALLKMESLGLRFLDVRLRVIAEPTFNRLLEVYGNKATLLTHESLALAKSTLSEVVAKESTALMQNPLNSLEVYFDKHGGRSKYAAALSHCWSEWFFQVQRESSSLSEYHVYPSEVPKRFYFVAKGDRLIPCGLASIFAKWSREMLMQRLNAFWQSYLPDIKPTAGYPVDAKRFAKDIKKQAEALQLDRSLWWRKV